MTAHLNLDRARRFLDVLELDGLLAATPENVLYVSGLASASFLMSRYLAKTYALVARSQLEVPVVVAALGDAAAIGDSCPPGTRAVHYGSIFKYLDENAELTQEEEWVRAHVLDTPAESSAIRALAKGLADAGLAGGRIGYDEYGLGPVEVAQVEELLPGLQLVPAWDTFRSIRAVKTATEIERLTRSLELTENALEGAVAIASTGVTESDMMREFSRIVSLGGGVTVAIDFTFGRRGALGNPAAHDAPLGEGDLIRFDGGCRFEGYFSDIARTFLYRGELSASVTRKYRALQQGQSAAIAHIRPGVPFSEIFHAGVEATRGAGLERYDRHHIGHSIGLEIYDGAMISENDTSAVEHGMFLEVELPYSELGFGALQLEDSVLVGDAGPAVLTRLGRNVITIE